jgi:hypothetical protein
MWPGSAVDRQGAHHAPQFGTLAAMSEARVSVTRLRPEERTLLSNLVELYVHDLSALFPHVELGDDGRFGYAQLPLYLANSERHLAFLIRAGERTAGRWCLARTCTT